MATNRIDALGAKLGPRLAELLVQAHVSTKKQLLDTERRLFMAKQHSFFELTGKEIRQTLGPLLHEWADHPELHDDLAKMLHFVASGKGQLSTLLFNTAIGGAVSQGLGELFVPLTAPLVQHAFQQYHPLIIDPATIGSARSRNLISQSTAYALGLRNGLSNEQIDYITEVNQSPLNPSDALQLFLRGFYNRGQAVQLLIRSGLRPQDADDLINLSQQLLAPADAALAVLRGNLTESQGITIAAHNGVSRTDFLTMVDNTGEPPAVEEMLSLWRRGKIDDALLERAVRQSRVRNEWLPAIKELGIIPPSPSEALDAYLEGQVPRDEAYKRYLEAGGDPTWFESAFNTRGTAPSPVELGDLANRGIIPWDGTGPSITSFHQGFLEGPWRNKWLGAMRGLAEYLPPPRTVTAMVKEGALTKEQGIHIWKQSGLSDELASAYYKAATQEKTKKHRDLGESMIVRLYHDQAISHADARAMLIDLSYDATEADFILEIEDLQREVHALDQVLTRIHTLYVTYKITDSQAHSSLGQLDLPGTQVEHILSTWTKERIANVRTLTESQIAAAVFYEIIPQAEGQTKLEQLGFTPEDAWIILSLRSHGPLPNQPA